ncbi:GGDEF domain-containing protein [Thalassotalea fusca]
MSTIDQLIKHSQQNELIARKLFEIETEILACQSSHSLLTRLFELIAEKFHLTDSCLLIVEPLPVNFLINGIMHSQWHKKFAKSISHSALEQIHSNRLPVLANELTPYQEILPNALIQAAGSLAFLPLVIEQKLIGSLVFADRDPDRYVPGLGTFHLEQLAVKVSLCLSNVMMREHLEYMANYDRLTGVANRRLMESAISNELIRQQRYNVPFSILFIDCNKFKQINDTYGHDCGDKVLSYVATQLQELIRENDQCFRYAGDEFVITLASQTYQEALLASKRLTTFFEQNPMPYEGKLLPITISCGVAASDGKNTMDELLKNADKQLYLHKKVYSQ